MIDINGAEVQPCHFTAAPCDPSDSKAPVQVGKPGKPDIVPLGALLAAAGVNRSPKTARKYKPKPLTNAQSRRCFRRA
jgi:hypothetical protein